MSPARISPADHLARPWRVHALAPDFELLDVWRFGSRGREDDFPAFVRMMARMDEGPHADELGDPRIVRLPTRARQAVRLGSRAPTAADPRLCRALDRSRACRAVSTPCAALRRRVPSGLRGRSRIAHRDLEQHRARAHAPRLDRARRRRLRPTDGGVCETPWHARTVLHAPHRTVSAHGRLSLAHARGRSTRWRARMRARRSLATYRTRRRYCTTGELVGIHRDARDDRRPACLARARRRHARARQRARSLPRDRRAGPAAGWAWSCAPTIPSCNAKWRSRCCATT